MFAIIRKCYHSVRVSLQVIVVGLVLLMVSAHAAAQTAVIRVDGLNGSAAPAGLGNGWGSNAYLFLQDALDQADVLLSNVPAPAVVQLWVRGQNDSDGFTYFPDDGMPTVSNPEAVYSFGLRNKVHIYGGFNGSGDDELSDRNLFTNITILSGDLSNNDSANWGNRSDNSYHVVIGNGVNNTARLDGFRIRGGSATGAYPDGHGGGIFLGTSTAAIVRCTFIDNQAELGGGAYLIKGGPNFVNCSFLGNRAYLGGVGYADGGGIYIAEAESSLEIVNTVFSGNNADHGGAIYGADSQSFDPDTDLGNCTFSGNAAHNSTTSTAGGAISSAGTTDLDNCIIWGNTPSTNQIVIHSSGMATVDYSDYQGGWGGSGTNNINVNPNFVDPDGAIDNIYGTLDDDVRLNCGGLPPNTPINTGNNSALPADTFDLDLDPMTTVIPHDRLALARIIGATVDMGAMEKGLPACPGEVTDSCIVNIDDMLAVIGAWGPCPTPPAACPTDIAPQPCGDGQVNIDDLLLVIGSWNCESEPNCDEESSIELEDAYDCMDLASLEYEPFSPEWIDVVEKCIEALEE